jgi:hypothetical protein
MFCKKLANKIAIVLPRYGASLGGGAETLVQSLVNELVYKDHSQGALVNELEIWTTCAIDHRTWQNELPSGYSVEEGIQVRRFPVDERNLDVFIKHEISLAEGRPLNIDEQLDWLKNSVNSSKLYEHISIYGESFEAIIFAPYLFATSFWGALIYPNRSIIIPCLHDEAYAYQDVFRALFKSVRGLIFNSTAEMELAYSLYGSSLLEEKCAVVGMGFVDSRKQDSGNIYMLNLTIQLAYFPRKLKCHICFIQVERKGEKILIP